MFDRLTRAFGSRIRMIDKTIAYTLLTGGTVAAEHVSLGTLPPGAVVLGRSTLVSVNFAGSGVTDEDLTIGPASDYDAIEAGIDVDGVSTGVWLPGADGVSPVGPAYGGVELFATLTPAGAAHTALTAGSLRVQIYYATPGI